MMVVTVKEADDVESVTGDGERGRRARRRGVGSDSDRGKGRACERARVQTAEPREGSEQAEQDSSRLARQLGISGESAANFGR